MNDFTLYMTDTSNQMPYIKCGGLEAFQVTCNSLHKGVIQTKQNTFDKNCPTNTMQECRIYLVLYEKEHHYSLPLAN